METALKWEFRGLDSRFSHVKPWASLPGLKFFPLKQVSQFQTFKVSSSSNILGNADGIAHETGSNWWLIWWDTSKSPIFPETFWLLIYRVRQAVKEEIFLLILVLRRTFPAGEGKVQFYPQEKMRSRVTSNVFSPVPSNFWAYLHQEDFLYTNQGSVELSISVNLKQLFCKECFFPIHCLPRLVTNHNILPNSGI